MELLEKEHEMVEAIIKRLDYIIAMIEKEEMEEE